MEIDVALSGSSTKFPIHIGALSALEECGYRICRVIGNSGGSLVGGLYAYGYPPSALLSLAYSTDFQKLFRVSRWTMFRSLFRGYVDSGTKFRAFLEQLVPGVRTKGLLHPFHAVTTNVTQGRIRIFGPEDDVFLAAAIHASSAIPGLWRNVLIDGEYYADGGLLKDFPVDVFDASTRPLVGVLIEGPYTPPAQTIMDQLKMSLDMLIQGNIRESVEDIVHRKALVVRVVSSLGMLDADVSAETKQCLYNAGYTQTKKALLEWSHSSNGSTRS